MNRFLINLLAAILIMASACSIGWYSNNAIYGVISDDKSVPLQVDPSTHSIQVINYDHHEMHAGSHFFIKTFVVDTGGNGSTTHFSFTTPDTTEWVHAKAGISPDVDTEVNIYEGATVTGGTPIVGIDNNRNNDNTPDLTALASPTISVAGTKIWAARTGGGRDPVGVAPGLNYEIIAKQNTTYVFEIIKRTTSDLVVDIDFWWYEHTSKD